MAFGQGVCTYGGVQELASLISWNGAAPRQIVADGWMRAEWTVSANTAFSSSCRLPLPARSTPFWCIPGLFWGDNQQDTTGQYYPRFNGSLARPGKFQSPFWEFHVWRCAQPVVAMHDSKSWWILEAAPYAHCEGDRIPASIGFEFRDGVPSLVASVPANERPYRPVGHDYTAPVSAEYRRTTDAVLKWSAKVLRFDGARDALLDFLRDNYHANSQAIQTADPRDYADATRNALLKWHYHPSLHYFRYTVAFDRVGQQIAEGSNVSLDRHEMALGWVSGWAVFEPLVKHAVENADAGALDSVTQTWNALMSAGLVSPSGYWWTRHAPRRDGSSLFVSRMPDGMDGNWMPNPHHLHLRTLGDAVWRAAKTLRLYGHALPFADQLKEEVVRQAGLVATLAQKGWPLPLSVDARSGEPAGLHGTAGMIWISVWSELFAMGLWEDLDLIRDGLDHYREAVTTGQLYGAPEDVGECVTSEDIYIAVNTFLDGHRVTGRDEDLATGIHAARWLYLWRKSFDHHFDPRTLIGVYGLKSRGGDLASFKNNHLHLYGLDVEESLYELAAKTGDDRWRKLADDHWAFAAQLTPLIDGQFNAYQGMVTEQFYFIDWSGLGNSVALYEEDERRADYDVGPHYRNHGNLAGFSHAWCTAFVLGAALRRQGDADGASGRRGG